MRKRLFDGGEQITPLQIGVVDVDSGSPEVDTRWAAATADPSGRQHRPCRALIFISEIRQRGGDDSPSGVRARPRSEKGTEALRPRRDRAAQSGPLQDERAVSAAPILQYMLGWSHERIDCSRKRWRIEVIGLAIYCIAVVGPCIWLTSRRG
jgi:hypothetical protein